jgi:hypothetical protein
MTVSNSNIGPIIINIGDFHILKSISPDMWQILKTLYIWWILLMHFITNDHIDILAE